MRYATIAVFTAMFFIVSGCAGDADSLMGIPTTPTVYAKLDPVRAPDQLEACFRESDSVVFLVFHTFNCPGCDELEPKVGELREEYGDRVHFVHCRAQFGEPLVRYYDLNGYPTVMIFRDGKLERRMRGNFAKEKYTDSLDQLLLADCAEHHTPQSTATQYCTPEGTCSSPE